MVSTPMRPHQQNGHANNSSNGSTKQNFVEQRPHSFNPNDYVIQLKSKEGMKDYLPVQWRLVWFRAQFPEGIIETEMLHLDMDRDTEQEVSQWSKAKGAYEKVIKTGKGIAVFRAVAKDGKGGIGTGTKSEKAASFPDYIEKAETGSIGRALAALGFGTQFAPEFDEGDRIVDAPVDPPPPAPTNSVPTPIPAPTPSPKPQPKQEPAAIATITKKSNSESEKKGPTTSLDTLSDQDVLKVFYNLGIDEQRAIQRSSGVSEKPADAYSDVETAQLTKSVREWTPEKREEWLGSLATSDMVNEFKGFVDLYKTPAVKSFKERVGVSEVAKKCTVRELISLLKPMREAETFYHLGLVLDSGVNESGQPEAFSRLQHILGCSSPLDFFGGTKERKQENAKKREDYATVLTELYTQKESSLGDEFKKDYAPTIQKWKKILGTK